MRRLRLNKILDLLVEFSYLAIVFFTPLYFALFLKNANVFELNKIVLFKILVLILFFLTFIKFIFGFAISRFKIKANKEILNRYFTQYGKYFIISAVYLLILTIAAFHSTDSAEAYYGSYERQQGLNGAWFYFLFFLLILINIKTKEQIKRIVIIAVSSSFFACLYGLVQVAGFDPLNWIEPSRLRITSTFGQPNFFASYLLLVCPLTVYLFFSSKKFLIKFIYLIVFIFQLLCLYFTYSRAGWVGFLAGVFIYLLIYLFFINKNTAKEFLLKNFKRVLLALLLIIFCSGCLFFLNARFSSRVKNAVNFSSGSVASRMEYWQASWKAIKKKPLLGWGPENQKEALIGYYKKDWAVDSFVNSYPDRAHNLVLDILLISGFAGLLFFLALIYCFFQLAIDNIKKNKSKNLSLAVLCAASGYFISLLFGFSIVATDIYFWLYFALLLVISLENNAESYFAAKNNLKNNKHILLISIIKIIIIALIGTGIFFQISKELNKLIADHYFREMQLSYVNKEYFKAYVLYGYLKDTKTRSVYYDKEFALMLSEQMEKFNEIVLSRTGENILQATIKEIGEKNYFELFVKAKIYLALASEKNKSYYDLAENYFKKTIDLSPEMPKNYRELAKLYDKKGESEKAEDNYNKALSFLPDLKNPDINLQHQNSIKYEKYLIYQGLGDLNMKQKQYQEAENYYKLAYADNIQDIALFKKIADAYYLRGDIDTAIWYNKRGMAISPKDYVWPYSIALLYQEKGDNKKALGYAEIALSLYPAGDELKDFINKIK